MADVSAEAGKAVPILYVADLTCDVADLFDLAFLLRSPDYDLRGICLSESDKDGERLIVGLAERTGHPLLILRTSVDCAEFFAALPAPINLVVTGNYTLISDTLRTNKALFREKVARLFLVGGFINNYALSPQEEVIRLPIDPRLRERNAERFVPSGDARIGSGAEQSAWAHLLTSGEGIIWLPRDIALWRYAAPGVLEEGGAAAAYLLEELGRHADAAAPVLLSALPALLLAVEPDLFAWMRLFRVVPARVEADAAGSITDFTTRTDSPNLYAVVAIDGQSLGKLLTARLRDRPLPVE